MRQTRLVLLALALLASPLAAMESEPLLPPDDAWDVRLAAGVHDGPPMLFVEVLPEFIWQEGIELRVTLNAWDGTIVEGVAWLDADHRAAFVPFPLPGWEGPAEERCQSPTYDVRKVPVTHL